MDVPSTKTNVSEIPANATDQSATTQPGQNNAQSPSAPIVNAPTGLQNTMQPSGSPEKLPPFTVVFHKLNGDVSKVSQFYLHDLHKLPSIDSGIIYEDYWTPSDAYQYTCAMTNRFKDSLSHKLRDHVGTENIIKLLTNIYYVKLNNLIAIHGGEVRIREGEIYYSKVPHEILLSLRDEMFKAAGMILGVDSHGME